MYFKIFLQQLKRGGKRTALYILLLTAVTAFFVMSVNLYRSSTQNLASLEDTYSTIAVMELKGDVNYWGELTEPGRESYMGYKSVAVNGYDFSKIVSADSVIDWDLREQYGAYIENEPALEHETYVMAHEDIIRFRLKGNEPVEIPILWETSRPQIGEPIELEVLDSAAGCYRYSGTFLTQALAMYLDGDWENYFDDVQRLNDNDRTDAVILYPGVEYVVTTWMNAGWWPSEEHGVYEYTGRIHPESDFVVETHPLLLPGDLYYGRDGLRVGYHVDSEFTTWDNTHSQPFPIQRWEDVENDAELSAYFEGAWEGVKIQTSTYNVTLTNDITGVPVYHLGGAYLKDGRTITEEEYESGAKVCMISDELAYLQGWSIGDTLDMQFFVPAAIPHSNDEWSSVQPIWHKETEGFFDRGEYEIVGIYAQTPTTGNSGIDRSTLAMAWNTIYVPHNSVENATPDEELPVHAALLTIWLENGTIDSFLDDMEMLGITEAKEGQYNPTFTFFDQGYSLVQPGLEAMHGTAALLLALSSVLLVVTCLLLAYFFAQSQKQSVGIFRMLGGSKGKSVLAVLACALVVAASGTVIGALAGHVLTERVGGEIMATSLTRSEEAGAFQAFVLDAGQEKEPLSVTPDTVLTAVGASIALTLPVALILCFVMLYIHKEPRALLPKGEN